MLICDSDVMIFMTHIVVIKLIHIICCRYYCVSDDHATARELIMKHGDSMAAAAGQGEWGRNKGGGGKNG